MTITRTKTVLAVAALILSAVSLTASADPDDRYLAGYAAAVLETRFGLPSRDLQVENGKLRLHSADLQGQDTGEVLASLRAIDGLEVELVGTPTDARSVSPSAKPTPLPSATLSETMGWLPRAALFDPLIADPRWPRFSATLQFYQGDEELGTVGAPNFGAAIPFYGWRGLGIDWQAGLQAGVFSIFDLNADSSDLINSDFFVGLPISARYGPLSAQVRVFHQSSHLGDEFLLRPRGAGATVDRINLSYEGADLRLSVKPWDWLRLYAGGGAIFDAEPDLDAWMAQGGFEITSPDPIYSNLLYPIVALDVQSFEESDWGVNYSARAGVEVRSEWLAARRLQLVMEYFNGRSPNGQFYDRDIEYFGPGLHFYF
ncbi:MAG: DUF1207 domain-containing protein [Gammaproteobacteria bacterium]